MATQKGSKTSLREVLSWTVIIAGLGYFVDMFDLTIFGVVRVESIKALGITDMAMITQQSIFLINMQAAGMLIGGLLWGIIGDKKGRLSVLFGSIILYSAANLLNAWVVNIPQYAILRFIAGVGLAGELGAAVTLVAETLSPEQRGYGTALIATLGLLGSVTASILGQWASWQIAYVVGGLGGIALLLGRFHMADSGLFKNVQRSKNISRGNLRLLLSGSRLRRYISCIAVGIPIYFITGILLTFAPELSRELGLQGVTAGQALLFGTIGLTLGDLLCGLLSQWIQSRKKAIFGSLGAGLVVVWIYLLSRGISLSFFYAICFCLGLAGGYWAVLVTVAAEQFGTNLRSTAATSVPNFVRASVILLTSGFSILRTYFGASYGALILGTSIFAIAAIALAGLKESFGKSMDFTEADEAEV